MADASADEDVDGEGAADGNATTPVLSSPDPGPHIARTAAMTPTVPAAVAAHTRRDLRAGAGVAKAGPTAGKGAAAAPFPAVGPAFATPAPARRSRRVWAATAAGTVGVMAAVLAMCGPGSGDESTGVVAFPSAAPSPSTSSSAEASATRASPPEPSFPLSPDLPAVPDAPPAGTPAPSPETAPTPAQQAGGDGEPAGPDRAVTGSAASGSARPRPGHAPRPGPPRPAAPHAASTPAARAPAPAPGGAPRPPAAVGPGSVCDQAGQFGHWLAGSDQARLCHSLYG
ncbi:hypothetical protein EH183_35245 [Streptomyces sp. CB01881]|nr:hypothetical protein C2142_35175 [Streptomyces sp. CB01881]TYC69433.1 hypothetical protein EH183_35245 [Streptomyces sp. CB01881]